MKKQTKQPVVAASSVVINEWNVDTVIAQWKAADTSAKDAFAAIVAHYGHHVCQPSKQGGFSANAVRNKAEEQYKAEASRLHITPSACRELHRLQERIKVEVGASAWQTRQTVYYKVGKEVAPKDEPDNIKAIRAEKTKHEQTVKVCRDEAKSLSEEAKKVDGEEKLRLLEAQAAARLDAARAEMMAKQCSARIKEAAEVSAGADAYGALHEALRKLGEKYAAHKDEEVSELARQVLALL